MRGAQREQIRAFVAWQIESGYIQLEGDQKPADVIEQLTDAFMDHVKAVTPLPR